MTRNFHQLKPTTLDAQAHSTSNPIQSKWSLYLTDKHLKSSYRTQLRFPVGPFSTSEL